MHRYVVLDTESSVCKLRRRRLLVSLAYECLEVTDPEGEDKNHGHHRVVDRPVPVLSTPYSVGGVPARRRGYHVVRLPGDVVLDRRSVTIHGISAENTWTHGSALQDVLLHFFACIERYHPDAIVGHDVVGDIGLLVSELLHHGCSSAWVPSAICRLVCTRMLATHRCAIPLPSHIRMITARSVVTTNPAASAGRGVDVRFKWPSLQESYNLLVNKPEELEHACHDARGDVERCRAIFLRLCDTDTSTLADHRTT